MEKELVVDYNWQTKHLPPQPSYEVHYTHADPGRYKTPLQHRVARLHPRGRNAPDAEVVLLLVHLEVCIVLRGARRGVAARVVSGVQAWERVGHVRTPGVFLNSYGIDWMGELR
ncbi:hypothetical protein BDU57DRAFT_121749 [Ampelomyces quisqualis]|uniref:Uncharacterized protein n=1 Tax=Ampelomyces quisqualis TaxID=50730 RepID=A0A6A5QVJ2_AMPQU|nr:hypothetical protein BDU57DRAFT_121749 [Ampelomyces quisqualis]